MNTDPHRSRWIISIIQNSKFEFSVNPKPLVVKAKTTKLKIIIALFIFLLRSKNGFDAKKLVDNCKKENFAFIGNEREKCENSGLL